MLNYETEMHIAYGNLSSMMDWCKRNCSGKWECSVLDHAGEGDGIYNFYFELEKDYVSFLIWKK